MISADSSTQREYSVINYTEFTGLSHVQAFGNVCFQHSSNADCTLHLLRRVTLHSQSLNVGSVQTSEPLFETTFCRTHTSMHVNFDALCDTPMMGHESWHDSVLYIQFNLNLSEAAPGLFSNPHTNAFSPTLMLDILLYYCKLEREISSRTVFPRDLYLA